jgi:hypothetical protein
LSRVHSFWIRTKRATIRFTTIEVHLGDRCCPGARANAHRPQMRAIFRTHEAGLNLRDQWLEVRKVKVHDAVTR